MKTGDLPNEPELELASQNVTKKARTQKWPQGDESSAVAAKAQPTEVEQDDFFEDGDDSE